MSPDQAWMVFAGFATVLGLLVGSFLNVCISRMPEDRSVVHPPSHCPACGHGVRPYDNIPVVSWLILRGRCRDCGNPISSLYPTIELLGGACAWLVFQRVVPDADHLGPPYFAAFLVYFSFVAMLIGLTYIDLKHFIIPDAFSIYAVPLGVAAVALLGWLGYPDAPTWKQSVVGALIGGGSLGSVALLYWLIRREEGMGMGDIKLLAMIGAFLGGLPAIPFVILVSSVIGATVGVGLMLVQGRTGRAAVPFGPFLALAATIYLLHGEELVERWFPGIHYMLAAGS